MKWDILTALDVCVDLIVTGDVTPRFGQAEQLVTDYAVEMGGSCAIFAAQCAKLGMRTLGIGVRGDDAFGALFEKTLSAAGVDTACLGQDDRLRTGLGIALVKGDDRAILTYTGTIDAVTPEMFTQDILANSRHLHIGSFYLMPTLRPHWPDIARRAKAMGMSISLDPNWDPDERWEDIRALLPYVDVLLPNQRELAALGGIEFLAGDIPVIAVKCGEEGAYVYAQGKEAARVSAFKLPYVDAIGAGDSFDGGFVSAWLRGEPLNDCALTGCACGGLNVRGRGGVSAQGDSAQVAALIADRRHP